MSIISGITCKNGTSLVLTAPTTVDLSVVNIYNTGGSNVTIDGNLTVPGALSAGSATITGTTTVSIPNSIKCGGFGITPIAYGFYDTSITLINAYNLTYISNTSFHVYFNLTNYTSYSNILVLCTPTGIIASGTVRVPIWEASNSTSLSTIGIQMCSNDSTHNYAFSIVVYGN